MTTNDGTPKPENNMPWSMPMVAPASTPAPIARYGFQPCLTLSTPMMAAHRPLTAPTDRSISPSSSTYTIPMLIRPTAVICSIRLVRFAADRKALSWE